MNIYDFKIKAQDGNEVALSDFTKFLIDRNGEIVARFEPTESLDKVKAKVEEVL